MMAKSWGGLAKSAILMAKQNTIMMDGNDASNGKWQQQNVVKVTAHYVLILGVINSRVRHNRCKCGTEGYVSGKDVHPSGY